MNFDPKLAASVAFVFATPALVMLWGFAAPFPHVRGHKLILIGLPLLWAALLAALVIWVGAYVMLSVFAALVAWIVIRGLRR